MRLFYTVIATAMILAAFYGMLVYSIPAHSAEPRCKAGETKVSWYGRESGTRTATGLHFDGRQMLVAHKSLPFGTRVRFTYRGRSIVLPVRDRGPYIRGRVFDLSEAAARALGTKAAGVACVVAKVLR